MWTHLAVLGTALFLHGAIVVGDESTGSLHPNALISKERDLMACLMNGYDTAIRPVAAQSDVINVTVDMILLQILRLNELDHTIEVNAWMQMSTSYLLMTRRRRRRGICRYDGDLDKDWMDSQLKWDPANYDDIAGLRIPVERIWTPDVTLLNSADRSEVYTVDKMAWVVPNGTVYWVAHLSLKAYCKFNLRKFPFDTQTCKLLIGSWTYDVTKVNLSESPQEVRKFVWDTQEWDVTEYTVMRKTYAVTRGTEIKLRYPYLLYTLVMERQGAFYGTILVAPAILMAVLILTTFLIPPNANERITLGIGIVIVLTLILSVLDDYLPSEMDQLPVLFAYVLFDLILATFSVIVSVVVLNCCHRGIRKDRVPGMVRMVALGTLRKLCCLSLGGYNTLPTEIASTEASGSLRFDSVASEQELETPLPRSPTMALEKVLDEIRRYLRILAGKGSGSPADMPSHQQLLVDEWHTVAMVIDRVMFLVFLVITIFVTIAMLSH